MFRNYLKIALRNILKRKAFSLINIIGLSTSIAVSILILLYVLHELSFDRYISNVDNKYRVISLIKHGGEDFKNYASNGLLAHDAIEQIPGVISAFQIYVEFPYVQYKENLYLEDKYDVFYSGEGIFNFFSVDFIEGDKNTALKEPFSLVLSESYAKKYFGDSLAIGKTLIVESDFMYKVTGVFKDQPENTHLRFNMLLSLPSLLQTYGIKDLSPLRNSFITYLELDKNKDVRLVEQKISQLSVSYLPPQTKEMGISISNNLQSIKSIHLKSDFEDRFKGGDIKTVYIFSSIAMLILILACINYINLSTAQFSARANEVAIRKTSGANKPDLIKQFITESFLIVFISLATALVIAEFFLPVFNSIIGFELNINYFENWYNCLFIIGISVIVVIISSLYPAFFLSSFKVVDIFKMKIGAKYGSINIRRVLVVLQFSVTIFLIISSIIIFKQLNFISNKDLGFDKKNLIAFRLNNNQVLTQLDGLKNEINQFPFVESSTVCSNYPSGNASWENIFEFEGHKDEQFSVMPLLDVDYDFFETMRIPLMEGRSFSKDYLTDSTAVLINESLLELMGWDKPIGKQIVERLDDVVLNYHVIGVFKDYHKESLHSPIKPMLIRLAKRKRFFMVRLKDGFDENAIPSIKKVWEKFSMDKPFQNRFIDEEFDKLYNSERNLSSIFVYFSFLAILIACLGLLGLIMFFAQQKTKEISIRKILGAKIQGIAIILTKEFIILQIISSCIAVPFTYFIMNKWIHNFSFYTNINWWVYAAGVLITAVLSFFVISIETYKAATANPADTLRYE